MLIKKIKGFELGEDDYLTKPCNPLELRTLVDAKIKKTESATELVFEDLKFVTETQSIFIKNIVDIFDKVDLTPIEFKLFYYLSKHSH
jgi:DNA-binding response OmpR family regulator